MAPTIFITGVSGYIGGQVLHDITEKHPEYQIRSLVRTDEQKQKIAAKYPSIQLAIGDLDSVEILKEEAAQADVVLRKYPYHDYKTLRLAHNIIELADADHVNVITTIISSLPKTSHYIQLSGAASVFTTENGVGQATSKVWSDLADLTEITTFDKSVWHAITDQLVLSEGKKHGIRTALVIPPGVVGTGQGQIKRASIALPAYVAFAKGRGKGFKIGEGKNVNSLVHVRDLADALILLVEEAFEVNGKADWGEKGVYYVEGGECEFDDVAKAIVKELVKQGSLSAEDIDLLTAEQAKELHPYAELLWGSNMRVSGERIRALGWKAKHGDVFATIPDLVAV